MCNETFCYACALVGGASQLLNSCCAAHRPAGTKGEGARNEHASAAAMQRDTGKTGRAKLSSSSETSTSEPCTKKINVKDNQQYARKVFPLPPVRVRIGVHSSRLGTERGGRRRGPSRRRTESVKRQLGPQKEEQRAGEKNEREIAGPMCVGSISGE